MDTPPTALKSARGVPSELPAMLMVLGWCMQASAAGAELIHVRTVSAIQTAWSDRAPHGQHARRQCSAADEAAIQTRVSQKNQRSYWRPTAYPVYMHNQKMVV